jgi:hypothetical protein
MMSASTLLLAQLPLVKTLPPFGSTSQLKRITNVSALTKASTGADQTWNFSAAALTSMVSYEYIAPTTVSQTIQDSFPGTTYIEMLLSGAPDRNLNPMEFLKDESDHILRLGTKSSGSSINKQIDTLFYFGHEFDSTHTYRGAHITYSGYGSMQIGGKTYDSIAMFTYIAIGSGDTTHRFFQFSPFFSPLVSYSIKDDTIQNAFYYEIALGTTPPPTSVSNVSKASVVAYPNPATNNMFVSGIENGTSYTITDLSGHAISRGSISDNKIQIDELHAGMYLLMLNTNSSPIRFIKQ